MPEYYNHKNHTIYLTGQNGETVRIGGGGRKTLPEYFERYVNKGYLVRTDNSSNQFVAAAQSPPLKRTNIKQQKRLQATVRQKPANKTRYITKTRQNIKRPKPNRNTNNTSNNDKKIVGKAIAGDATQILLANLQIRSYPISNNIGVGILSYNRAKSLRRLLDSILRFTDLNSTTIFISDDASDDQEIKELLCQAEQSNSFIVLRNNERLGVAGNTNRLLQCLSRFKYGIILNDDIEVLNSDWDRFYQEAMIKSGFHHFCLHQPGIYGAKAGTRVVHQGVDLSVIHERPHGAVIAFTHELFTKIGYFDESFGQYGMEHVDWSGRAQHAGLQPLGFYDVVNSSKYFKMYPEQSAVDNRQALLAESRKILADKDPKRGYVQPTPQSLVPSISVVIPCRNLERHGAIEVVVNNIRAQHYPDIQIIVVEHDTQPTLDNSIFPVQHRLSQSHSRPFNKSKALNLGVSVATNDNVVLHDADIVVGYDYIATVAKKLVDYEACHLGKLVLYIARESTSQVIDTNIINDSLSCERIVGYFEGGSLACNRKTYWRVGGFIEDFEGWGVEDCEFYQRLMANSKWLEDRTLDFVHLWHGRAKGWDVNHNANKELERRLLQLSMTQRIQNQHTKLRTAGYSSQIDWSLS